MPDRKAILIASNVADALHRRRTWVAFDAAHLLPLFD